MNAKLHVQVHEEAQEAEIAGDFDRAMELYAESGWHFKAVNLALNLGRVEDAKRYYKPIQGDMLPNRNDEPFVGMTDSIYLGLVGPSGRYVGFSGFEGKVLDIGCRDGRFFDLIKRLGARDVYGVNPDSEALAEAGKREGVDTRNLYDCGVEELPASLDGFFDYAAIFNFSMGDKGAREKAMNGVSRVLKPDGRLLATFSTIDELRTYSPEVAQHFRTPYASLIKGSGELDSAPHRYAMHGVRK